MIYLTKDHISQHLSQSPKMYEGKEKVMKHERKALLSGLLITLAILAFSSHVFGEAATEQKKADQSRFMFVDEIEPGMKGYGLTVFSGTKIERFDIEIISVVYNISPRSDLILAKVSGGPIAQTGVIAGMSGSPVYIDGRMIGALAYSWPFSTEAIAGITPIKEMLNIFDYDLDSGQRIVTNSGNSSSKGWAESASVSVPLPTPASEYAVMKPIMTPMVFSGFPMEVIDSFRPQLEGYGIIPMVGGSFADYLSKIEVPFEEGSAIGVQLVRGDLTASAVGTVTLNKDGRVLAFGHPFMLSGSVSLPMTTAYVHTVLPSLMISSKMATALKSVGALTQDRSSGIAGIMGGTADMVPVTLKVNGPKASDEYHFEVARNRQLLPSMIGMALTSSLSRTFSNSGKFAAAVHYDIDIDGYTGIHNDDFISGLSGFPTLTSMGLFGDLNQLLNNEFKEVSLKSVSIDVKVKEAVETAQITGIRMWKNKLEPGESVDFKVIMQPFLKDKIEKDFRLKIPESFPEGRAFLQISAASQTALFERMRNPHHFQPTSIEKLISLLDEAYPGNQIDVRLLSTDPGVVIDGEEMAALPSSVFSVISQSIGKEPIGITKSSVLLEDHFDVDFEVSGFVTVPIEVSKKTS